MARVLIVEDDSAKLRNLYRCLTSVPGLSTKDLENCIDASEAKRRMRARKYQLVVIDIMIPNQPDQEIAPDGGISLLEEISECKGFIVPDHIIGITAHEEVEAAAVTKFRGLGWTVLHYAPEAEAWEVSLRTKASHIVATSQSSHPDEYRSHLAIVCALDRELDAIKRLPWAWSIVEMSGDHSVYYRGEYSRNGETRVVHAGTAARMGMVATAVLTTKMIQSFRPKYVAMAGIAAGVRGEVELGDVIVADYIFDYGSGKIEGDGCSSQFSVDPHHIQLPADLRPKIKLLAEDDVWLACVRKSWPGEKPGSPLKVRLGPLATGAAVVADSGFLSRIRVASRKLLGVDMESYGLAGAVAESTAPQPQGIVMKSVCDFADEEKNDRYQDYAAYTSAAALARFAEVWL
jgi:nucleoside phosphorylase/CheY-like chemotaxis protein